MPVGGVVMTKLHIKINVEAAVKKSREKDEQPLVN